jgi:hypothetical protein
MSDFKPKKAKYSKNLIIFDKNIEKFKEKLIFDKNRSWRDSSTTNNADQCRVR